MSENKQILIQRELLRYGEEENQELHEENAKFKLEIQELRQENKSLKRDLIHFKEEIGSLNLILIKKEAEIVAKNAAINELQDLNKKLNDHVKQDNLKFLSKTQNYIDESCTMSKTQILNNLMGENPGSVEKKLDEIPSRSIINYDNLKIESDKEVIKQIVFEDDVVQEINIAEITQSNTLIQSLSASLNEMNDDFNTNKMASPTCVEDKSSDLPSTQLENTSYEMPFKILDHFKKNFPLCSDLTNQTIVTNLVKMNEVLIKPCLNALLNSDQTDETLKILIEYAFEMISLKETEHVPNHLKQNDTNDQFLCIIFNSCRSQPSEQLVKNGYEIIKCGTRDNCLAVKVKLILLKVFKFKLNEF